MACGSWKGLSHYRVHPLYEGHLPIADKLVNRPVVSVIQSICVQYIRIWGLHLLGGVGWEAERGQGDSIATTFSTGSVVVIFNHAMYSQRIPQTSVQYRYWYVYSTLFSGFTCTCMHMYDISVVSCV